LQQRIRGGGEGADLLPPRTFTIRAGRAHTRLEILLADIQCGAPLVQQFHQIPPNTTASNQARPSGGTTGPQESGPRAHGNNRQFLSVAPNAILTPRAQTASQTCRRPGRTPCHFPASTAASAAAGFTDPKMMVSLASVRTTLLGGGSEGDRVAEGFELSNVAALLGSRIDMSGVVIGAQIVVSGVWIMQQVPDDNKDGATHGDHC